MKSDQVVLADSISIEEQQFEQTIRPQKLVDFVGQKKIKDSISIFTQAAKKRAEALEHVLVYGPPGLGKTTLANIIANEMNSQIRITSGPAIERAGDLASILTNLNDFDVLFIDEIHRLNKIVQEVLYSAMEDYTIDLVIGKGPAAKTMRIDLPKFTLVGATTRIGTIAAPMRDRFGVIHRLDFYSNAEMQEILNRSAKILNIKIDSKVLEQIAYRSRSTPRIANRILRRIRDVAEIKSEGLINSKSTDLTFDILEIDNIGLTKSDRLILDTIHNKFSGGPVGLSTLSAATNEDVETICDVYEPYLLQIGFIMRTPQGRVIMPKAVEHLKLLSK